MRKVDLTDDCWDLLLRLKDGAEISLSPSDPAHALYGPIASARNKFVLAQVGQSLDGRVATPSGDARDISGPDGLAHLHRCRALVDAVIVGVGTVKADDPRLSVRMAKGKDPVRVIIDCRAELKGDEGIFTDGGAAVLIFQSSEAPMKTYPNADVIRLMPDENGLSPQDILSALADRNLSRILVEGGARTIARFIDANLVNRLHVAIAPIIIGSGPSGITLPPIDKLSSAHRPATETYTLGSDIVFDCLLRSDIPLARQSEKVCMADLA